MTLAKLLQLIVLMCTTGDVPTIQEDQCVFATIDCIKYHRKLNYSYKRAYDECSE